MYSKYRYVIYDAGGSIQLRYDFEDILLLLCYSTILVATSGVLLLSIIMCTFYALFNANIFARGVSRDLQFIFKNQSTANFQIMLSLSDLQIFLHSLSALLLLIAFLSTRHSRASFLFFTLVSTVAQSRESVSRHSFDMFLPRHVAYLFCCVFVTFIKCLYFFILIGSLLVTATDVSLRHVHTVL